MDRESTTVHVYMYTDLIIDVDLHTPPEYLSEPSNVGLTAFMTKLKKSSLIVSLKENKRSI